MKNLLQPFALRLKMSIFAALNYKRSEIMEQSINTARNGVRHCEGLSNITDEETRELFTDSNGVLRSVVFVDSDTGETFFP